MDESGYGIGTSATTRVLAVGGTGGRRAEKGITGRQEWVRTIECVAADGQALPRLVIFKGKNLSTSYLPTVHPEVTTDWHWCTSDIGWSNDTLALEWLKNIFLPFTETSSSTNIATTVPSTSTSPPISQDRRLLIVNGHGSHVQSTFIALCIENAIDLVILPSHSSHKTQPLNVAVFTPMKLAMADDADKWASSTPDRISKGEWTNSFVQASIKAMTPSNIRAGWRGSGLWPFRASLSRDQLTSIGTI
ncbi:hypothetical protein TREMEDRAFT_58575 [Tremella mesenterica DSM 1558]|uniref:uncharacterized protein n=1 Tax=Tremella mesenterica (strain ATCC 24925 / CBS 8224 / DSM 1558 / NBRC 9311 / NRRL Y-6157 / RJB 2259-6 / UBC 559-6) TaxID=578456 RepID=UPI0003F48D2C|nr:uncharacterized protein TREMEDRAFT_58575 [Tremella mesenterica DSM 1558]EIW72412.1 hypothetical protein TREMEDRAFT_58575 [Tremella mesenterica DSM 1558]